MKRPAFLWIALAASLSAQESVKQAFEARFWLKIPAGQSPLRDIEVSTGSATPAPWENDPAVTAATSPAIPGRSPAPSLFTGNFWQLPGRTVRLPNR